MYALAAHEEKDENSARWMDIAKGITNTCHESYDRSDTKLGPEAFRFTDAVEARALKANERYYILRPETFESYFIMWRLTHDQKYRDWGWEAVEVKYSRSVANFANWKRCESWQHWFNARNMQEEEKFLIDRSLINLAFTKFGPKLVWHVRHQVGDELVYDFPLLSLKKIATISVKKGLLFFFAAEHSK